MTYDLVLMVNASLEPTEAEKSYKALLEKEGLKVLDVQNMGKKTLAYFVKKQKEGVYLNFSAEGTPAQAKHLESTFKLDSQVLRHLIIRKT